MSRLLVILLLNYPREGRVRKRESPKNGWDTGVSVLGAFKLDYLQPVKRILSQNVSKFLTFILGLPASHFLLPQKGESEEKGFPKKWMRHNFQYLGHSNRTICSLLSWFCPKNFPSSWSLYWGSHFLLTQSVEMRKRINPKMDETQRIQYLGHSNWTICSLLSWSLSLKPPSLSQNENYISQIHYSLRT